MFGPFKKEKPFQGLAGFGGGATGLAMHKGASGPKATGGTMTESGGKTIHTFTSPGTFTANESLTGDSSGAVWVVSTFDTLQNTNSEYDANREIEDAADNLIDWSEGNPFGEYGNFTGSI